MTGLTSSKPCPCCDGTPTRAIRAWLRRCPGCGVWTSDLDGERPDRASEIEETRRETGLRTLRRYNSERILDAMARHGPLAGARMLEVGCGHGWFLESAARRGVAATGLEPDTLVAAKALAAGLQVRAGYFPDAVGDEEAFDIVVFNDVFEHLEDPPKILRTCARILRPGGRLVLNLPDSDGFMFRTACRLARLGADAPLERLWQARFRCPHLWYFNGRNLEQLVSRHGFRLRQSQGLLALRREGLWARLRMDCTAGWLQSALYLAALQTLAPLLARASPDIVLHVYERSVEGPQPSVGLGSGTEG